MFELKQTFLSLVKLGIGHRSALPDVVDWKAIKALADKQGLTAIIVDGIEQLPDAKRPPKEFLLQWIGEVFQNYENRYKLYQRTIAELAGWYNTHGYKMMVLKGYACSIDWPRPEHRPCGDIDIWLFGKQKEADAALAASSKFHDPSFKIDSSHHHHTVFDWCGFSVENHYDFVNVYAHKSSAELEKVFKELGENDSHSVEVLGEKVYLPSPNLHALFLIRHMVSHFAAAEITLRQVLDWAFFVQANTIDWQWLLQTLDRVGMKQYLAVVNAICTRHLGFSPELFPKLPVDEALVERSLNDILHPEIEREHKYNHVREIIFRFQRWWKNGWKNQMVYKESRWQLLFTQMWSHILKPSWYVDD